MSDEDLASILEAAFRGAALRIARKLRKTDADLSADGIASTIDECLEETKKFVAPVISDRISMSEIGVGKVVDAAKFLGFIKGSLVSLKVSVADSWRIQTALKVVFAVAKVPSLADLTGDAFKTVRSWVTKLAGTTIGYAAKFEISDEDVMRVFSPHEVDIRTRLEAVVKDVIAVIFKELFE